MAADCPLFPENPSHCNVIVAVKRTIASLSMIGSFFIIFIIWLFQKYKYFEQRLLLALSVAAFMSCISYLMGELHPEKGPLCVLQAWWLTYFNRCVILWVCCITFNLYWNLIKDRTTTQFEKWYHAICWVVSLVISLLPLIDDHYGPAGPWCWIPRESSNSTAWRFMMWYVPLFIIITILFIVYGYIFYTYRKREREWAGMYNAEQQRLKEIFKKQVRPLMAYPCIYLVTSICPLIHRIYNVTTETPSFPLLLLHVIFNPLAGALNAIAYGFDKETLSRLNRHQIKMAFLNHFRPATVISEYQTDPTETVVSQNGKQSVQNYAIDDVDYGAKDNEVIDDVDNEVINDVDNDVRDNADNEVINDVDNVRDNEDNEVIDDVDNDVRDNEDNEVIDDVDNDVKDNEDNEVINDVDNDVRDDGDNEVESDVSNEVTCDTDNEITDQKDD